VIKICNRENLVSKNLLSLYWEQLDVRSLLCLLAAMVLFICSWICEVAVDIVLGSVCITIFLFTEDSELKPVGEKKLRRLIRYLCYRRINVKL
jgi:hypothetical protein